MLNNAEVMPTLPVTDMKRAKAFYKETLGLQIAAEMDSANVMLQAGNGSRILLYKRSAPTKADNTAAAFNVDDLDQQMRDLRSRGVTFEEYDMPGLKTENGVASMDGMRTAWFKDPFGNILAINEGSEG